MDDRIHKTLSEVFTKFHLGYVFTSSLISPLSADPIAASNALKLYGSSSAPQLQVSNEEYRKLIAVFTFSKPSVTKPFPDVSVDLFIEFIDEVKETGMMRFLVRGEGQLYHRTMVIDPSNVSGEEFNESLIDKIYLQKRQCKKMQLWVE